MQTLMLILYISVIYMAWRGCRFILYHGFTRASKTDNSNSLTLSFYINLSCRGCGEQIYDIMKRTLLFLMSVIMVLSAYAQKSTSIKVLNIPIICVLILIQVNLYTVVTHLQLVIQKRKTPMEWSLDMAM